MQQEFSELQIHTAEPLFPEPSFNKTMFIIPSFKFETLYENRGSAGGFLCLHKSVYWGDQIKEEVMVGAYGTYVG
jgi:hypothetical protein